VFSDISEGVVSQLFFETQYGLAKPNGPNDSKDIVSFKLVSVLQASAIFGALGSAPVSGISLHVLEQAEELITPMI